MIERLYKLLLVLSPREFRERFGEELLATARAVARERTSFANRLRAIVDAGITIVGLHVDSRAAVRNVPSNRNATSMDSLGRDLRFAARALWREPAFTLFVTCTLALGISANAAMYGVADRLLLRGPEHIRDADRVAKVFMTVRPVGMNEFTTSYFGHVEFDILRSATSVLEGVAQYSIHDAVVGRGNNAQPAKLGNAAAQLFPLLGVQPVLGRFYTELEDRPNAAEHVVVLSHARWLADFDSRKDAIGETVSINDETYSIIGVAPRAFTGPSLGRVDYWIPASLQGPRVTGDWTRAWNAQWLEGVVRMKPKVTREQVENAMTSAHRQGKSNSSRDA